jgi:predicted aspartyl protease
MCSFRLGLARTLLALCLLSGLLTIDLSAATRRYAPATRATAEFEALPLLRSRQNHLLVRAFVNGKPAWLGVDTGAPVTAIALDRRSHFRLTGLPAASTLPARLQINGAFNNVALIRHLQLGNLNLEDEPVVTVDLGGPSRTARIMEEQQLDGILGADILFPTKAILDCRRQLLVLKMDPDLPGRAPGISYRGLNAVPIEVSEGFNLYVRAKINGTPARLMIDTGAFATLLHQPFVRQMRIPTRETAFRSAAVNLKQRGVRVARIRKISVGSVDIIGKEIGVIDLDGLIHQRLLHGKPPVVGLLGAEILNRHHGIIDFGTRTLYLKR